MEATAVAPGCSGPTSENGDINPMEQTNKFEKLAKATGMGAIEDSQNYDIEETATKPLLSPMIIHQKSQQAQMLTTNKFSNFGFFAGSPRQTCLVENQRNIDSCKEDEIEVSIEEAIEETFDQINKDRVKALTRQKSKNTQPDRTHPITLLPKKTVSPEMENRKSNRTERLIQKMGSGPPRIGQKELKGQTE